MQVPIQNEKVWHNQSLPLACMAWVAIAAIAWGFYFGFRRKENRVKGLDSRDSSSYEVKCCMNKQKADKEFEEKPIIYKTSSDFVKSSKQQQTIAEPKSEKQPASCISSPSKRKSKSIVNKKDSSQKLIIHESKNIRREKSQYSEPKEKKKCCPCGKTETDKNSDDVTDRPSTASQFSQRILQEDVQMIKQPPHSVIKYDFNHVKDAKSSKEIYSDCRVNQEIKKVESMKKESISKVMRPVPTYSTLSQRDKPKSFVSNTTQSPIDKPTYQENRPNYLLIKPLSKSNSPNEQSDKKQKATCCTSTPNEKRGNIRPIIEGYKVEGHIRVKGTKNPEPISIPEDSYEVIR